MVSFHFPEDLLATPRRFIWQLFPPNPQQKQDAALRPVSIFLNILTHLYKTRILLTFDLQRCCRRDLQYDSKNRRMSRSA